MDNTNKHTINKLKLDYQKNLTMGMFLVSCLVFLAALFVHFSREETVVINIPDKILVKHYSENTEKEYPIGYPSSGYENIPSSSINNSCMPVPVAGLLGDAQLKSTSNSDFHFAVYESNDDDNVYGVGGYADPLPNDSWSENDDPFEFVKNKPIIIADYCNQFILNRKKDRPLMIQLKKPQYPRGLYVEVDATVTLGMTLNSKGIITDWTVYYEEPSGKGFAFALQEALRESYIKTEIRNGREIGGHYIITYDFCEKCPDKPVVVQSPGNVIISF
jgi:hypothetical protein